MRNLRTKLADQVHILPAGWRERMEDVMDGEDDREDGRMAEIRKFHNSSSRDNVALSCWNT